jgi:hypothetical protein
VLVEASDHCAPQQRQIALGDPGADVLGSPYVQRAAGDPGELERLEPGVEGEVRCLTTEFVADPVPDRLELFRGVQG